jgi:hypothetical protein
MFPCINDDELQCPYCGDHYVHPVEADTYQAEAFRHELNTSIRYYCEQGSHEWWIHFRFHGGTVQIEDEFIGYTIDLIHGPMTPLEWVEDVQRVRKFIADHRPYRVRGV